MPLPSAPTLEDLIDVAAVQSLMEDFYALVGVPVSVVDTEGRVLVGVGWQDICTRFHRVHPDTCRACLESDTQLTTGVQPGEFRLYKCKNNMWDVATPIVVGNRHVGNVFSGQFFFADEAVDHEAFRQQARRFGFDENAYLAALNRVPKLSREAVNRALAFYVKLAHMVSRLGDTNASLARAIEERDALIDARDRALHAESRQREQLRVTMASMGDGVIVTDERGRVTFLNKIAEMLTGWSSAEAQHRPLGEVFKIVDETSGAAVESPVDHVLRTGVVVGLANHTVLIARDGQEIPIEDSAAPVRDEDGTIKGIVLLFRDGRERRKAERALEAANADLQDADRRKDEWIAILSHELRNPLAPIRFALPLLRAQPLDQGGRRALAAIDRQTDHLARLVDDLLDISRITSGKVELRRERVTLDSILTAATEAASPAIVERRHTLKMATGGGAMSVQVDPPRIAQVLTNLLDNSAKYTPPGGEITLEAFQENNDAVIRVRDNGLGIPRDALQAVFDMFRQVQQTDRPQGGLGIGLALAKRLVEMHGGTIEAQSEGLGRGAQFTVRLPLASQPAHVPEATGASQPAGGSRLRVLIVDDNEDLADMLSMLVEGEGHTTCKASDGSSAVSAALAWRPDVVLLDLGLPGMDGIAVAKELRRHPELAGTTLVALTGWGQPEDRLRTSQASFAHHLTKPADARTVLELLARIADENQAAR